MSVNRIEIRTFLRSQTRLHANIAYCDYPVHLNEAPLNYCCHFRLVAIALRTAHQSSLEEDVSTSGSGVGEFGMSDPQGKTIPDQE